MIKFFGNHFVEHKGNYDIGRSLDFNLSKAEYITNGINSLSFAAKIMGKTFFDTVNMRQMHTANVVYAHKFEFLSETADGIVTTNPDLILCIRTADCAPILFFDNVNNVIGAAHAGWRGALNGIIKNTADLMMQHRAKPENIKVFIGPLLTGKSFECKEDMKKLFIEKNPSFSKFFEPYNNEKMRFDFPKFIEHQLNNIGLSDITYSEIYHERWNSPINTYTSPEYHSYRRAKNQNLERIGLNCACISL
jgi:YfiH family protein